MLYLDTGIGIGRSQPHAVVTVITTASAVAAIATRFHGPPAGAAMVRLASAFLQVTAPLPA